MTDTPDTPGTPDTPMWIDAAQNPWGMPLLDLRPITQGVLSMSSDQQMAANAVSYNAEDGLGFVGMPLEVEDEIDADIVLPVDPMLAPGVLFIPREMEHKWAIFFHRNQILFVRSWLRKVFVIADTTQSDGLLHIHKIRGEFIDDVGPELTGAMARFLLISHTIGELYPAPIPVEYKDDPTAAAHWAFSAYGNMAHMGIFATDCKIAPQAPMRSHSLLHIATARNDLDEVSDQIAAGVPIDLLAGDGLAALHWSLAAEDTEATELLIKLGADPNVRSVEGATPIMNAVQSQLIGHMDLLIAAGADVNALDDRGFTALHRAAEIGHTGIVEYLLEKGADANVEAEGHTPLSLAELRAEPAIVEMLKSRR
jgi:hypothetical protein